MDSPLFEMDSLSRIHPTIYLILLTSIRSVFSHSPTSNFTYSTSVRCSTFQEILRSGYKLKRGNQHSAITKHSTDAC